jgi:phosphoribosylanthranilate isomerase
MVPGVKICGITRAEDALLAQALGASAVGFVFWPGSPRFVDPAQARLIVEQLKPEVTAVGVFVDEAPGDVRRIVQEARLGTVQLHGDESVDRFIGVGTPIIKAVPVGEGFDPALVIGMAGGVTLLLDAHDPVRKGGTGRTIDWAAVAVVARARPVILSGGLHAGNVGEAVARVRPRMIDVSSGVESAPGLKDPDRLRALFRALETA